MAIRDHFRQWICGFSRHRSVHKCKLRALSDGLSLASFMVFSDFIVELDALVKIHPNLSLRVDDYVSILDNPWSQ